MPPKFFDTHPSKRWWSMLPPHESSQACDSCEQKNTEELLCIFQNCVIKINATSTLFTGTFVWKLSSIQEVQLPWGYHIVKNSRLCVKYLCRYFSWDIVPPEILVCSENQLPDMYMKTAPNNSSSWPLSLPSWVPRYLRTKKSYSCEGWTHRIFALNVSCLWH